ncbi:hypothetical protein B0O99DRAFT_679994 [Bisporella sp. PMI_857]|nr:hypothetical protein B0O99DRAFT_679994 [Bisporella sp. PMI_857]
MTENWRDVRFDIKCFYLTQRKPPKEVQKLIEDKHAFKASTRVYKNKIDEWGRLSQDEEFISSPVVPRERSRLRGLEELPQYQAALVRREK